MLQQDVLAIFMLSRRSGGSTSRTRDWLWGSLSSSGVRWRVCVRARGQPPPPPPPPSPGGRFMTAADVTVHAAPRANVLKVVKVERSECRADWLCHARAPCVRVKCGRARAWPNVLMTTWQIAPHGVPSRLTYHPQTAATVGCEAPLRSPAAKSSRETVICVRNAASAVFFLCPELTSGRTT